MNALDWLKERQRKSLENQAIFDSPIKNPFEQTAHGFKARNYKQPVQQPVQQPINVRQDRPSGLISVSPSGAEQSFSGIPINPFRSDRAAQARLPLSMRQPPEVKNKLVQKNDGSTTFTKEWVSDPRMSGPINTRPGTDGGSLHHPVSMGQYRTPPQSIRGAASGYARPPRPVSTPLSYEDISNLRSMHQEEMKPKFQSIRPPTASPTNLWGLPVTEAQANTITDQQPGYGQARSNYLFGDTMAPGVGSMPAPVRQDLWGRNKTEAQANMITDQQPGYGDPRRSYLFGDTTAPGVGSAPGMGPTPSSPLSSMGIPLHISEWIEAQKREDMLQRQIRQRLDPSTLRQPYKRSGGIY
tara:strand:- start:151 stop:1215 length:1065 start_codon:yes stop_codon:yes gene_type:complete